MHKSLKEVKVEMSFLCHYCQQTQLQVIIAYKVFQKLALVNA